MAAGLLGLGLIVAALIGACRAVQAADKDVAARDREMKGEGRS